MTDEELERALRAALRLEDPGEEFTEHMVACLPRREHGLLRPRFARARRWLPWAVAACLLAGIGLSHRASQHQRARASVAQLLQALDITSGYVNLARDAVIREESEPP